MRERRTRIPGVPKDAERNLEGLFRELDDRLKVLERKEGRPGFVSANTAAKVGEFLNIEAPAEGLSVVLPQATPALRNARVTLATRNANPVKVVSILGSVNGEAFLTIDLAGVFECICNGLDGWELPGYIRPEGAVLPPPGDALAAHYLLGQAHAELPNAAVATDTSLVNFAYTPGGTATWTFDTAAFLALIDSTSIVVNGSTLERAAVTGAISIAQNSNDSLFRGIRTNGLLQTPRTHLNFIDTNTVLWTPFDDSVSDEWEMRANFRHGSLRDNGSLETAQTFLNFVNQTYITFNLVQDAGNQEIEVRAGFLGSFYNENSVGSIQTPFISYDDSTMLTAGVTDNTGGSGYVNITFDLAPQSAGRIIGRARGAGTGIPTALTGAQVGSVIRFNDSETLSFASGLQSSVAIAEDTVNPTWQVSTAGALQLLVRSIAAPAEEGQLLFPSCASGDDEIIYLHEDPTQTAAERIVCPDGIPYRFNDASAMHALYYHPSRNRWMVLACNNGYDDICVIDEDFDWSLAQTLEGSTPVNLFRNHAYSWCAVANPVVGGSAGVNNIDNSLSHRGILRLDTGIDTNDACAIYVGRDNITGVNTTDDMYDSDNITRFACWVRIPITTLVRVHVGFMEDPQDPSGGTDFLGFSAETDGATSTTNWVMRNRSASTNSDTDTGVAAFASTTAWHRLEWFRFSEFIVFHLNRVLVGVITSSTNAAGTIGVRVETLTAAERQVDVDRLRVYAPESTLD